MQAVLAPQKWLALLIIIASQTWKIVLPFSIYRWYDCRQTAQLIPLSASEDCTAVNEDIQRLKHSAELLRAEVMAAQEELSSKRSSCATKAIEMPVQIEYDSVADSCWEITYRFADEPESTSKKTQQTQPQRTFYTGKIKLQFRSDGYTDILIFNSQSKNASSPNDKLVEFQKVWGWDLETSNEDSLDYLLFSADIALPPQTGSSIIPMPERFYFQARVDKKKDNKISLQDGSVTVKRNIESGTGGWWGLFRGADGILAQFREVGQFRCKAVPKQ